MNLVKKSDKYLNHRFNQFSCTLDRAKVKWFKVVFYFYYCLNQVPENILKMRLIKIKILTYLVRNMLRFLLIPNETVKIVQL